MGKISSEPYSLSSYRVMFSPIRGQSPSCGGC